MRAGIILFFSILAVCVRLHAQQDYSLVIHSLRDEALLKKIAYKKTFSSKSAREKELQKVLSLCYDNAYLLAAYDSVITDSLSATAYLDFGKPYKWAALRKGNVDEGVLSEIGFREKMYAGKPLKYKDVGASANASFAIMRTTVIRLPP